MRRAALILCWITLLPCNAWAKGPDVFSVHEEIEYNVTEIDGEEMEASNQEWVPEPPTAYEADAMVSEYLGSTKQRSCSDVDAAGIVWQSVQGGPCKKFQKDEDAD